MADVSDLNFESGPPKKVSLTYTLAAGEEIYMAFIQDLASGNGQSMDIDRTAKSASTEYEWQPGYQYRSFVTFAFDIKKPGTAPASETGHGVGRGGSEEHGNGDGASGRKHKKDRQV